MQGVGGFLRPFRRIGGTLWLEVTGVLFLLPVVVFAPTLWRTRMSFAQGPDHRAFVAAAVITAIFFYFGVSSFWRARRRSAHSSKSASKVS
jgi:type VI protein secretion system component VasK